MSQTNFSIGLLKQNHFVWLLQFVQLVLINQSALFHTLKLVDHISSWSNFLKRFNRLLDDAANPISILR